jgi:hypothetical protein
MRGRLTGLVDYGALWAVTLLAYGVVGFLRGRGALRWCWEQLHPGRNFLE